MKRKGKKMLRPAAPEARKVLLELCYRFAGDRRIVAACEYGPLVSGYGDESTNVYLLLILTGFVSRLKAYKKAIDKRNALFLVVDQKTFQDDVSSGWLGEIAAEKLLIPYEPMIDSDYLWHQEIKLKKRIIWELLESIILEFPELSHELLIKPEYFMHQTHMQRAKLFPAITYRLLNIFESKIKEQNIELLMKGYKKALTELAQEKWITLTDDSVGVTPRLVKSIRSRKIHIPIFLKSVQRSAVMRIFTTLPKIMAPMNVDQEIYATTHANEKKPDDVAIQLEEPENYLLMPTPLGPVPLSDETTIEEFVRKSIPGSACLSVETRQIGGVLNSVYQLTLRRNEGDQKVVVKKFKDWTGFKWFPLTLWSLGTKSFAVLGKSRLEREYAINQYLQSNGMIVPKVLYVSPKQSMVFQEFIEGVNLAEVIRNIISGKSEIHNDLELLKQIGRKIAEAHRLGVSLGDCKPENIIVTNDGKICFIDLEQASRDGNHSWDVAEFLYYSGHYAQTLAPASKIEMVANSFIEGYLEAGGNLETVRNAASPRYTKVFSIFTQPHVILAISNLCRKAKQK